MSSPVHPAFAPKLLSSRDEAPGIRTFRFMSPAGFTFVPGQFVMFHFADDPKTWRAYSICSAPAKAAHWFEITVGMVGAFSDRLGFLTEGGEHGLIARGPFGKWIYDVTAPHAVLVAGGTGVTPFRAMCLMKANQHATGKITVCCSAKNPDILLYRNEYEAWRKAGITVLPRVTGTPPSEWNGLTGRWTPEKIVAAGGADPDAVYYLCGPNKMVQELRDGLQTLGVHAERVRTEKWGDYAD
ncbi:MAG: FAD-dependent oxidoreductase, partial [Elusimicrobia bacterium]|nr:FAD-dependent oxidoreductase [Elusimicrobiota bacterium]